MNYLWIDPWVRKLWYWIIDDDLNILDGGILLLDEKNPERQGQFHRINQIVDFFESFTKQNKVSVVWIEKLYFTVNNQSNAEFVYGVRWALIWLFMRGGIKIVEFTPKQIKKSITWNGNASKLLVQQFIMKIFRLESLPEYNDTADALWIAYLCSRITTK